MSLTDRVAAWEKSGTYEEFRKRRIFVRTLDGDGPPVVLLHGFPSSSYDWRHILGALEGHKVLAFDFLGFGLSEKPADHVYTLAWQADLSTELVRRHFGDEAVFICAHDMGTSIASELMAREIDGELGFATTGALLFNGSMILERASPTIGQKLLRSPIGAIAARLSSKRFFRQQFGSIFSPSHPLTEEECDDQWCLLTHSDGQRIGHKTIHYMDERITFAERWHGAIANWPKQLSLAWAMLDPVATPSVLEGLRELRPHVEVTEFADLGHYPQLEDPVRISEALQSALSTAH